MRLQWLLLNSRRRLTQQRQKETGRTRPHTKMEKARSLVSKNRVLDDGRGGSADSFALVDSGIPARMRVDCHTEYQTSSDLLTYHLEPRIPSPVGCLPRVGSPVRVFDLMGRKSLTSHANAS
ncbi:hypothetical protein FRB91_007927 [Serendipita sp. 411]|nr:hypothetical protein FRB91_007927 [Serendipita sp. 411]